ncbi:hypothetical protein [Helicobacter pullorum]|uniref:hypothetical protein n=1 Tax=Helicobacter pullorum TaxID=35818 RepID=UPI0015CF2E19|nr:hypothetical protein [Helicobacter pullorum]
MSAIDFLFFLTVFVALLVIAGFSLVSTLLIVRAVETAFGDFYGAVKKILRSKKWRQEA